MDGSSNDFFIQGYKLGGLAKSPTCSFEGLKKDSEKSSFMWKFPEETNILPMAHVVDIKCLPNKVTSPLGNPLNEPSQARPCTGSVKMIPVCSPASLAFCKAAVGAAPIFFRGHAHCSGLSPPSRISIGNVGMKLPGNLSKVSQCQPNMVDSSNICHQRLMMLDDSGHNKRILCHPLLGNPLAATLPSSSMLKIDMHEVLPTSEKHCDGKDASLSRISFPPVAGVPLPKMPANCGYILGPHGAVIDSMSSTSDNCHMPHFADAERTAVEVETENIDGNPELSYFSHENTEDIEALLSSDLDEVSSTGHSPSHLTMIQSLSSGPSNAPGTLLAKSMKRKRTDEDDANEIDDDIRSTATSGNRTNKHASSLNVMDSGRTGEESWPAHAVASLKTMGYNMAAFDVPFADNVSSNSSANHKKLCKRYQELHQLAPPPVPTDHSRKEKIKNILRLLRGVIPGGECMDTAFVLDEAIQYVRTLQSEVHKLQAKKVS